MGDRDLQVGDEVKWFYPCSEWESPRPFTCLCGTERSGEGKGCIGLQRGSKYLSREVLQKYFVNKHVADMVAGRDGT